ncbi:unnamed protein product [Parajaminaea phylloscopi]
MELFAGRAARGGDSRIDESRPGKGLFSQLRKPIFELRGEDSTSHPEAITMTPESTPSEPTSSSESSASGSRSPSPVATSSRPGPSSTQRLNEENTRDTVHYLGPTDYEQSNLLSKSASSSSRVLEHGALKGAVDSKSDQQLWLFKLPDGVELADLDGLTINLDGSDAKVGTVKVAGKDAQSGLKRKDRYSVVSIAGSASRTTSEARNAKAGHSAAKARKEGEKSQLVDVEDTDSNAQDGLGGHMRHLQVYVPSSRKASTGLVMASPMPISRRFEVLLDTEDAVEAPRSESRSGGPLEPLQADPSEYRRRGRNLRQLQGFFAPCGSLYDEDNGSQPPSIDGPLEAKEDADGSSASRKRKKVDGAAEDGDVSTSPAKEKKTKKAKKAAPGEDEADSSLQSSPTKDQKKEKKRKAKEGK